MADGPPASPSKGRWYILLLISVMYLITYLDRVNISTAAPAISKEFGFSNITMGYIFSAFVWSYALFQVPGGWLSDRFGARRVLGSVVAYWSIMTAATGFAFSATSFIVTRFLFGIGEAGAFPGATRAMQLWYPRQERGFVQGITHSASRAGAAIAPPIVLLIMINLGWRWAFFICGAIGFAWSLWWSLSYRNLPEEHAPGESRRARAHPRHRRKRRDQSAADREADQRAVEHAAAFGQYVGDHARLFHLRLLPLDLSELADEVPHRRSRLHVAQRRIAGVTAAVGRRRWRHRRRPFDRLAPQGNRKRQDRPARRSRSSVCWAARLASFRQR